MITVEAHTGDSRRCSNCRKDNDRPKDVVIAGVGTTLCVYCIADLQHLLQKALLEEADRLGDEAQRHELGPLRATLYQKSDRLRTLATKAPR